MKEWNGEKGSVRYAIIVRCLYVCTFDILFELTSEVTDNFLL